jgi:hypothetical protein
MRARTQYIARALHISQELVNKLSCKPLDSKNTLKPVSRILIAAHKWMRIENIVKGFIDKDHLRIYLR